MGPFSREKGRGEVRGLKKKEVEEFPPPPRSQRRSDRKGKRGERLSLSLLPRVFFFVVQHITHALFSSMRGEKAKRGNAKGRSLEDKGIPLSSLLPPSKKQRQKTTLVSPSRPLAQTSTRPRPAPPGRRGPPSGPTQQSGQASAPQGRRSSCG